MTPYERYISEVVENKCQSCKTIHSDTQAKLNQAGWQHYSGATGDYAICPACEKIMAEQAAIEREKEKREDYRGEAYGT